MLFVLFAVFSTAAQAMLLTLDLRWNASAFDSTTHVASAYNLQEGSIIQVIGYKGEGGVTEEANIQFGDANGHAYGRVPNDDNTSAEPYDSGHVPSEKDVWLAENTQAGHDILYTGSIQANGIWYGLYTQITVDDWLYDHVYIRVFGATEFKQGEVVASYWGVSESHTLNPVYQTDTLGVTNLVVEKLNYFEVIPEPATTGLLGLGGIALVAWRRRRRFSRYSSEKLEN